MEPVDQGDLPPAAGKAPIVQVVFVGESDLAAPRRRKRQPGRPAGLDHSFPQHQRLRCAVRDLRDADRCHGTQDPFRSAIISRTPVETADPRSRQLMRVGTDFRRAAEKRNRRGDQRQVFADSRWQSKVDFCVNCTLFDIGKCHRSPPPSRLHGKRGTRITWGSGGESTDGHRDTNAVPAPTAEAGFLQTVRRRPHAKTARRASRARARTPTIAIETSNSISVQPRRARTRRTDIERFLRESRTGRNPVLPRASGNGSRSSRPACDNFAVRRTIA